jgi:hypothetical protein
VSRLSHFGRPTRRWIAGGAIVVFALAILALLPAAGGSRTFDSEDGITLSPQDATVSLGTSYTLTATAVELGGNVDTVGHTVTIQVTSGPDAGQQIVQGVGPDGGQVSLSFTNATTPGTDQISASVVDNDGGTPTTTSTTVKWVDTTAPTVHVPGDLTVEATGPAGAVATFSVTATDPDDTPGPVLCDHNSGDVFPLGTTTVTCSSTDTHGNKGSASFNVVVQDTTPPTISGVPASFSVEATGPSGAVAAYTNPTASDLVDGTDPVNCAPASGSTFPLGTTTVNCSATDAHGNTATASFQISVVDTTPPTITVPTNVTAEATGPSGAAVTYTVSATDLVDGTDPVSCAPASGSTFPLGTTTVNCSSSDAHGNTANASFTVTVQDTTPPQLNLPSGITAEATSPSGAPVTYKVTATDAVDPNPTVVCKPASGSEFPIRTTVVTCTATDSSGNRASGSFNVRVVDTTPPTLTVPADISVQALNPDGTVVRFTPRATDIADANPSIVCKPKSGTVFPVGQTTVSCTATDSSGNDSPPKSFKVTVTYAPAGGGAAPPAPQPPPPPPPSSTPSAPPGSVIGQPVPGKTEPQVKVPGTTAYVPLSQVKALPPGTSVNVSGNSAVKLTAASNKQMVFFGVPDSVPSVFTLNGSVNGVVQLTLAGGNFNSCGKGNRKLSVAGAKSKKPLRRLWGSGKGRFTTKGKYASATVRGTEYLVADYCDGTLVNVRRGLVAVRDFVQNKTKMVAAGHSYFAPSKAPPKKKK